MAWIKTSHPDLEVIYEANVPGGSKTKDKNGNYTGKDGRADIIAYDNDNKILYVWEVKIGRAYQTPDGFGKTESSDPGDLDHYISKLKGSKESRGYKVQKGFAVPRSEDTPAPSDPRYVLGRVS